MPTIEELHEQQKLAQKALAEAQLVPLKSALDQINDHELIAALQTYATEVVDQDAKGAITNLVACLQSASLVLGFAISRNEDIVKVA
jgi:hypothetical protein